MLRITNLQPGLHARIPAANGPSLEIPAIDAAGGERDTISIQSAVGAAVVLVLVMYLNLIAMHKLSTHEQETLVFQSQVLRKLLSWLRTLSVNAPCSTTAADSTAAQRETLHASQACPQQNLKYMAQSRYHTPGNNIAAESLAKSARIGIQLLHVLV
jgi:hypothetical protein